MEYSNPYGWLTAPVQLPGRTRKAGLWITSWVNYGRPVIMDTRSVPSLGYDARRREIVAIDPDWRRRYSGGDPLPDDALLVMIHPKMYRDLRMTPRIRPSLTGPEIAAAIIDDVCRVTDNLAQRMDWKIGVPIDAESDSVH